MLIYKKNEVITAQQFIDLLNRTSLGPRRPVDDVACIQGMLDNANLTITAWQDDKLVGIARSVTDFVFCCYLSDLAVDEAVQQGGIGRQLIAATAAELGPKCTLHLISAPLAMDYYPKVGFEKNDRCWQLTDVDALIGKVPK